MTDLGRFEAAGRSFGRAPAVGAQAMVATPSGWASAIGIETLRSGGNAVDAAISISAALIVAQPHQCGLGGDAFWLIRNRQGPTVALNASGRAPAAADRDTLLALGHDRVPPRSGWAVTVPGLVAGWSEMHSRYARLGLDRLIAPAVTGASMGLAVTPLLARQLRVSEALLAGRPESARVFRPTGANLRTGSVLAQPDLARTLTELAQDPKEFYVGHLAEKIVQAVGVDGGWLRADDLAQHTSEWTEPLSAQFGDWSVEEMPPNSQGVTALVGLKLLADHIRGSAEREEGMTDAQWAHYGVEAAKVMMAVRDAEVGDQLSMRRRPVELLGDPYLDPFRAILTAGRVSYAAVQEALLMLHPATELQGENAVARPQGDTVHFAVVDADGLAVSCIQSVFDDFGSGIVVPGTGILLHSRGGSFSLQPGQVNSLEPGRRPMHTLAPAMACSGGQTAAVFGSMGGHAQSQVHVQMITGLVGQGLDPATVVSRPRWFVPAQPPDRDLVLVENRDDLALSLQQKGHRLKTVEPFAQEMGHAQAIVVDATTGTLMGATDPRSDGVALGY